MSGMGNSPAKVFTVTEIVNRIANAVRISVGYQWVEGEVSNLSIPDSGHAYFTLKDVSGQIACVIFKTRLSQCSVTLRNGLKVKVYGEANVFEKRGQIQLNLTKIEETGLGDLQARFLELKMKLEAEGLFDPAKKRPIPLYPKAIGLITSATGAAIQDIRHIMETRAPWVKVYLLSVPVQGEGAERIIARAIRAWSDAPSNGLPAIDTLIIARGGGSLEDLWNFNEEVVARAMGECRIPIISGVGHETDFTIADFVADMRAPTPTAAAMLATPDGPALSIKMGNWEKILLSRATQFVQRAKIQMTYCERSRLTNPEELLSPYVQLLDDVEMGMKSSVADKLLVYKRHLESLELKLKLKHPRLLNEKRKEQLASVSFQLTHTVRSKLTSYQAALELTEAKLLSISPQKTLSRGYALVRDADGSLVRNPDKISQGDLINITVTGGSFNARKE